MTSFIYRYEKGITAKYSRIRHVYRFAGHHGDIYHNDRWRVFSSRNISNLVNQTGYIAVLAVGMTLVIVIRHIDLSVGFLAGFLGQWRRSHCHI